MERVTGIGGFFFRAVNPDALATWYLTRLGMNQPRREARRGTVAPAGGRDGVRALPSQDSEMIGPPEHTWMINFRVNDLDAIVLQLRNAGETVEVHPERYPNGRFAELRDPEGNSIQLWQPMEPG